ncbi:MAG: CsgG/HfaB family protein [Thermodesulfobacteriota bacterium]
MKKIAGIVTIALCCFVGMGVMDLGTAAEKGMRYSIMVSKFENRSNWRGQWDLGDAWGAVLTDSLNNSGKFIVLGEKDMRQDALDEQDFAAGGRAAGGGKKVVKGQMTPAQLLVKGEITHFDPGTSGGGGGVGFGGIRVGVSGGTAEINTVMYIVDSSTGQVVASKKCIGKVTKQGLSLGLDKGGFSGDVGGFRKTNTGKAVEAAVDEGVTFLISKLEDIPWTGDIITVKSGKAYMNRGSREGVAEGQVFNVGKIEVMRDPNTGEVLDQEIEVSGKIKASKVKEKLSICDITQGNVKQGMTVMIPE